MTAPRARVMAGYTWNCECPGRWATKVNGHTVILSRRSDGWGYSGPVSDISGGRAGQRLPEAARTAVRWARSVDRMSKVPKKSLE